MARASYFSWVEPTWQTITGGPAASSRYIVYSEVPGGVLSTHGSALVPLPAPMVASSPLGVCAELQDGSVIVRLPLAGARSIVEPALTCASARP
jgi:hypothetical protein